MEEVQKKSKLSILTNGFIKEYPVLVLVIGTCPTLATSTSVETGLGMGLAATAVLVCSNIVISALHKLIPDKVRIPCFITVIAGFVTIVQMLLQAFVPSLYSALGLYLPLIVVNCIILGRAEMFASKNTMGDSALDGLGMGLGFTLTLCVMGSIREILGSGTWLQVNSDSVKFHSRHVHHDDGSRRLLCLRLRDGSGTSSYQRQVEDSQGLRLQRLRDGELLLSGEKGTGERRLRGG